VTQKRQLVGLLIAVAVLLGIGVGYTAYAKHRADARFTRTADEPAEKSGTLDLATPGQLFFRDTEQGPGFGKVSSVRATDPRGVRTVSSLDCERFYAAAGTAVCLRVERGGATVSYLAAILDTRLHETHRFTLGGLPNRARVSASGRMASWTAFSVGDSYGGNNFSTRTSIVDTRTGGYVENIEDIPAFLNGKRISAADVNLWGVTFARDDNTFYATLATKSHRYLVRGDWTKRRMDTVRENMECPSISPDNTRLVFKKRVSPNPHKPWRLYVLDLATMREHPLAETVSVDDQAAWLDDHTVVYARTGTSSISYDLWTVPADGSGAPAKLVEGGFSPAPAT
jgi:hypothetical protein